jgi:hypothetical protein
VICHLPLVAAVFLRSPLFSDFAGVMSLKMSLAANVSELFSSENFRVKFLHFSKHRGVRFTRLR